MRFDDPQSRDAGRGDTFVRRVGIVVAIVFVVAVAVAIVAAAWQVLLVAFLGILGGILLDGLTSLVTDRVSLPRGLVLVIVILTIAAVAFTLGWLVGPSLVTQSEHLAETLPPIVRSMIERVQSSTFAQTMESWLPQPEKVLPSSEVVGRVAGAVTGLVGGLAGALFILVVAVYFAARPGAYVEPAVRLVPPRHRPRAEHLIATISTHLRSWLVARFVSMVAVGLLTGVGLWIAGIPAAAALGVLAGALSFIPNVGPVLAALPGVLLGLAESPAMAAWASLVYVSVQILEGNLITPFAEQRAVDLPPAFLLTVQLLMGVFAGMLGLLVATPLLVVVVTTIRELYVAPLEGEDLVEDDAPTECG